MLTESTIQLATTDHARQIAELSRDHIERGLGWRWTETRVTQAIRDPDVNVAVVLRGSRVAAFGVMRYRERHAHLELLATRPAHRRTGLASATVRWLERVALIAGAERVLVECRRSNDAARCLYQELGFHERQIAPGFYGGREDGIRLEKWLRICDSSTYGAEGCVFRLMPGHSSGASRAGIPVHGGPPFRGMPAGVCEAG